MKILLSMLILVLSYQSPVLSFEKKTDLSNWNTYSNKEAGFSIKYPKATVKYPDPWICVTQHTLDGIFDVLFGTEASRPGGLIWVVSVYKNMDVNKLIDKIGRQFNDRMVVREQITINGYPAIKVKVTTKREKDWICEDVFVIDGPKVFSIGNGAVVQKEFTGFYKSFRLLK